METSLSDKNYYEILEIPTDASPEEVYQGYIRAKNAYSSDSLALYSLMSPEECEKISTLIDEAYSILSEPQKRRQYDEARGLNSEASYSYEPQNTFPGVPERPQKRTHDQSFKQSIPSSSRSDMTKIVAQQRFGLDYPVDEEFEKEIEQTSEFTGEFLKKIREYKQVDIPRLSEMTKVSKTYLRHIEDEYIDGLPAMVYMRGFVYQYAKCLKLNPDMVATSYVHRIKKLKGESSS